MNSEKDLEDTIKRYGGLIYTVVSGIIGRSNFQDVEECVTDVFMSIWKGGIPEGEIKNLVITIARRRAVDKLRSMKSPVMDELSEELADYEDIGDKVIERLNSGIICEILQSLPPPDGEIFIRRYYYCQSVKEIARALHRKPSYVRDRLYLAKGEIRRRLLAEGINY